MVEPLVNFIRTAVTQSSLSGGLQQLLQSGSQRGVVQNGSDGKAFVTIKGFQLPLQTNQSPGSNQANLQPGQQVTVRLQNGQILIEPVITKPASTPEQATESARTISTILSQLGVSSPQAQVVSHALLQSNIPLNTQVILDLAQAFPQLNPESMQALIFLISRRLPISDSMLYWMTRMNTRRENIGKLAQSVSNDMDELQHQLEDDGSDEIQQIRGNLGDFQDQLQREFLGFQQSERDDIEDDLSHSVKHALVSAESILSGNSTESQNLSETIVRLLAYLLQLQGQLESSPQSLLLQELTAKVEALQEALSAQSMHNIPAVDSDDMQPVFLSLPLWKDHEGEQLELLYKPSGDNQNAGTMDLRVELSNLGALHLHLGWHHPQLNVGINTERKEVKEFLDDHVDDLKDGLSSIGFQVNQVNIHQTEIPSTLKPEPNPLHAHLSGIDVKV